MVSNQVTTGDVVTIVFVILAIIGLICFLFHEIYTTGYYHGCHDALKGTMEVLKCYD